MKDDREYYRRRIEQEMVGARITSCAAARNVHLQLADLYSRKLRLIEAFGTTTEGAQQPQAVPQPDRPAFGVVR